MKIQIRSGVFETNSSSVHTITMCKSDDFEDWVNNKKLYHEGINKFLPIDEAINFNSEIIKKYNGNYDYATDLDELYITYDKYIAKYDDRFELFEQTYNGVTAFGYFGFD